MQPVYCLQAGKSTWVSMGLVGQRGPTWASVDTNMDRGHRQSGSQRDRETDRPTDRPTNQLGRGGQDTVYKHHHTAHSITGIPTASGQYSAYKIKIQHMVFIRHTSYTPVRVACLADIARMSYTCSAVLPAPTPPLSCYTTLWSTYSPCPVLPVTATFAVVDLP
ncbi:hypothetical protein V500_08464 [Pseudogymnoascus sp. VKM F-4518 (FW-2643)]|nr:hypothetical protein V500_08464 [Pseudogymnoascus sp. VKM F-4518 (FW-2643)]